MQFRSATSLPVLAFGFLAFLSSNAFAQSAPAHPPAPAIQSLLPTPAPQNANPFPPADPRNFTAASPSKETVNDFLRTSWGYDPNRIWQVQAILTTPDPGVSQVVALVTEKGTAKARVAQLSFFVLPGGKFLVSNAVLPFGSKPFQNYREILQAQANGPSKGAASKDLEFVEFADFECPHCKEAQPVIAKLLADYPSAHFVYVDFPLVTTHDQAFKAAGYGVCVYNTSGNDAFFKFADAVFDNQVGLTDASATQTLSDAASKAGQDPAKIAACAATPATKAAVEAQMKLGEKVGVTGTPTLFANGRALPLAGIPYGTLETIINFQAKEDGLTIPLPQPELVPPAPSLRSSPK